MTPTQKALALAAILLAVLVTGYLVFGPIGQQNQREYDAGPCAGMAVYECDELKKKHEQEMTNE